MNLLEALKGIKVWQIVVLIAVVALAAAGTYVGYTMATAEETLDLGEDRRLVSVQRGDLVNEVSVNGSLVYANSDTLSFGTDGTVADVVVEEGQRVQAGEALARLDSETIAELERKIVQAEGALRDAEEALAEARDPYSDVDLARAEADIADALVAKRAVEDALADLQTADPQAVARARAAVSDALIAKMAAEDELADLQTAGPQAVARARSKVADALVAKRAAEDGLEALTPTPRQIAEAEKAITTAEAAVRDAEESLGDLLAPPSSDMLARAEDTITKAKRTLQDAQDALAELLEPSEGKVAAAEAAITRAEEELENANTALDELLTTPDEDLLADAMSDLESARVSLNEAQLDLTLAGSDWDGKLETARDAVDTAAEGYAAAFSEWLGSTPTGEELAMDPEAILAAWGADIEALFSPTARSIRPDLYFAKGSGDDPETRWDESVIYFWLHFFPQDIMVTCEDDEPSRTPCIMRDFDETWNSLTAARDSLATLELEAERALSQRDTAVKRAEETVADAEQKIFDLQEKPDPLALEAAGRRRETATHALQDAESALAELLSPSDLEVEEHERRVDVAAAALDVAEAELADLKSDPDDGDMSTARAQLALAKANLEEGEFDLAELRAGPSQIDLDAARAQVELATANLESAEAEIAALQAPDEADLDAARAQIELAAANLESAEADLADLLAGPDPLDVGASRKKVALATANVADLNEKLAEIRSGADPLVVSLRGGDVAAAKSALDALHEQLAQSVITAPWNGIVTSVKVEEGQDVKLGAAAVEMVDPTTVEVAGTIDEIDILFVKEGAEAAITLDALPGQTLSGTVSEIGAQTTSRQGGQFDPFSPQTSSVLYPITIQAQQPRGIELPEGLTALASLVIEEDLNVLRVPIDALFGTFDQPVLKVMTDGVLEDRKIEIGNTDDFWAVVESGVSEGEMVVLETRPEGGGFDFGRFGGGRVIRR